MHYICQMSIEKRLVDKLRQRSEANTLRSLTSISELVDFSSNDYLGLARVCALIDPVPSGSGGSRLLTGNYPAVEQLEQRIALMADAPAALFYSSGYAANVGLLSCLPQRSDIVLFDELVHASIRDGIRLSHAKAFSFRHNDFNDLESKLKKWEEQEVFVVVESVYSMDGDTVDCQKIKELYKKYKFNLIIDEAHSFGLSRSDEFQTQLGQLALARAVTFGKAFGADGAAVLGSTTLRDYLINFSRSFIYSTAPCPHKISLVKNQIDAWRDLNELNVHAQTLKKTFVARLSSHFQLITGEYGNVVGLIVGDVQLAKHYARELQRGGFDVRAILSPTVAEGAERLRICFHAYNTADEVDGLISLLMKLKKEVG